MEIQNRKTENLKNEQKGWRILWLRGRFSRITEKGKEPTVI